MRGIVNNKVVGGGVGLTPTGITKSVKISELSDSIVAGDFITSKFPEYKYKTARIGLGDTGINELILGYDDFNNYSKIYNESNKYIFNMSTTRSVVLYYDSVNILWNWNILDSENNGNSIKNYRNIDEYQNTLYSDNVLKVVTLSSTKFLVLYMTDATFLNAVIGNISSNAITWGTPIVVSEYGTNENIGFEINKLSSTKCVTIWGGYDGIDYGLFSVVLNISTDTITLGTKYTLDAGAYTSGTICSSIIDSSNLFISYYDTIGTIKLTTLNINGSDVIIKTNTDSNLGDIFVTDIINLSSNKYLLKYGGDNINTFSSNFIIVDISNLSSYIYYDNNFISSQHKYHKIEKISSTKFLYSYSILDSFYSTYLEIESDPPYYNTANLSQTSNNILEIYEVSQDFNTITSINSIIIDQNIDYLTYGSSYNLKNINYIDTDKIFLLYTKILFKNGSFNPPLIDEGHVLALKINNNVLEISNELFDIKKSKTTDGIIGIAKTGGDPLDTIEIYTL